MSGSSIHCRMIHCHVVLKRNSWSTLNPRPNPPAQRCLGPTNSSRLTLVNTTTHNMPAHTTKDMTRSAVTTHHADTKEDAAQILCEWYNNVHTDMIGYFPDARGQKGPDERDQSRNQYSDGLVGIKSSEELCILGAK